MSSPGENFDPASIGIAVEEPPRAKPAKRKASRRSSDQLGIAWLHGSLHIGVLRQRKMLAHWSTPDPVRTVEEFTAALDGALSDLEFVGTETFLIFAGEQFVHQSESAPAFSASATRHYLQGRVERYAKEHEPMLWVGQPTISPKDDRAFVLHMLPQSFYSQLNSVMLARRLELTRILPMTVPVLRETNGFPVTKGEPVLVAVELADATLVVVARAGGLMLFSRTILASLENDAARVAVEINRSLFYAKQQFAISVDRIWLLARNGRAVDEVKTKCGAGKMVLALPTQPEEWLQTVTRVSPNQPVNLVADYLERKQRHQFIRRGLIAACWIAAAWLAMDTWSRREDWGTERRGLAALRARETALTEEHGRLSARNAAMERAGALVRQVNGERLPAVPGKFLVYLAGVLPAEARLTDFNVRWDAALGAWSFQCEGVIAADEDTARETLAAFQRHLTRSPLRARFAEAARAYNATAGAGTAASSDLQRFSMEGVILEN